MEKVQRAYSCIEVKAVNEDRRVVRGIATTPGVDRVGDIIEPMGVSFKNPLAFLWQHKHDQPIGTVRFEQPTEIGRAACREREEDGGVWGGIKRERERGMS